VDCTEWSWWTPAPFAGGGTGGKATKVETEDEENPIAGSGTKVLPVVASAPPMSHGRDSCGAGED
jgi:hypothetical protein